MATDGKVGAGAIIAGVLLISTTHRPATELGYLLHKNPARIFAADLTFGKVQVAYPEATEERATAALIMEVDPVRLVRGRDRAQGSLAQYVNDRPYVASSFLSVAIAEAFGTAMGGRSKDRPELADTPIPLEIRIPLLSCRGPQERIERLFAPMGYAVQAERVPLDAQFPEWGESPYFDVTLTGTVRLRDALRHLYILVPVLDARKHYFLDPQEVQKLLAKGEGWLVEHPEKESIVRSYLGRRASLVREAFEQLANAEETLEHEAAESDEALIEVEEARPESLHRRRHARVVELVRELAPKSVLDLGCGDGKLIRQLLPIQGLDRIVGMDVSYFELEKAHRKLRLEDAGPRMRERVTLLHGSLMYRDARLEGFDVCCIVEVVEHLDAHRLEAFERVVFEHAKPKAVILTTPNREYNETYGLEGLRHTDHRFEWSRAEFESWAGRVAERFGYGVRIEGVGDAHEELGQASQLAVFTR
jgi:3' terminal RNA ribose 2'-O-methyltransferase Hen1